METIYFKGTPVHTYGDIPAVGSTAPDFTLTGNSLQDVKLSDYKGKRVVLNVFPSLDTPVCAMSVRKFNQEASKLEIHRLSAYQWTSPSLRGDSALPKASTSSL